MTPTPSPDTVEPTEAELFLAERIRCTPGQPSGYAISVEESVRLIRQHVAAEVARETAQIRKALWRWQTTSELAKKVNFHKSSPPTT